MALRENVEAFAVKQALSCMNKDPEKNLPKLLDWFDRFDRKDTLKSQRKVIREVVLDKDNNWHQLVMSLWKDIDPGVRNRLFENFIRVKNFVPAISIEGFEDATDSRRGEGTYQKIIRAMNILKAKKLPFGISCCYTSANAEVIRSEAYFDQMIDMGAKFAWFFTYMPVGKGAVTELMATAEQREMMYHKIREYRKTKPLFMGYHDNQPWNENLLRPCPVLDNPGRLTEVVEKSHAKSTDYQNLESVKEFSGKCVEKAAKWATVADRLWEESHGSCASCGRCARAVNE